MSFDPASSRSALKVAYLSPTGSIGGAESCLLDLLASAKEVRPDWQARVLLGGDGPLRREVEALGVACEVLPLPDDLARLGDSALVGQGKVSKLLRLGIGGGQALAGTLGYIRRLSQWLKGVTPDVVQSNGMKTHILSAWATRPGLPVVWHLHDYLGPRPAMAGLLRLSRREGLSAVAVSKSVAEDASTVLGPRVPVKTIYNRIDLDRFKPGVGDGSKLDHAAGMPTAPEGTVRVGLVATFAIWKGHEVFLEAVSRIPKDRPARFYIVGGPIYQSTGSQVTMDDLRRSAERLGVADRVVLTGHLADPAEAIRALDVVVHASVRPEPFGRVIVEGMACGRAVVAMLEGGAAELFVDGETALGCPPNDPVGVAAAIDRLIVEPEIRQRLGRAGREAVLQRFDRTRLADDWASVYGCRDRPPSDRSGAEPLIAAGERSRP